MRILQVEIENFRGVANGVVRFPQHALLVGPNNSCKSTVLDALDLVLGPERTGGPDTIDEHDFHRSSYLPPPPPAELAPPDAPAVGPPEPLEIRIRVALCDLSEAERTRFRAHFEPWKRDEYRAYTVDELEAHTPTDAEYVLPVGFRGWYEEEEDEFRTETVFLSPPPPEGERYENFSKRNKQAVGFLYLRSLRTGRRAATLQRGSLLDILLDVSEARPKVWTSLLDGLAAVGDQISQDPNLRAVLDSLEEAVGAYFPLARDRAASSRLHVTRLTREHLRNVITYFLASYESGHPLPFDRLGSGVTNVLVLALLTRIAERKGNVMFAMEEPEIALGPAVQRRIVGQLKTVATQVLMTSHSPYVAEQMLPDSIVVLRRSPAHHLSSATATASGALKEKIVRQDFRHRFAEGLLGSAVLVVEGVTELYALPAASTRLAMTPGTAYQPFDLLGIIPVSAGSDGELAKIAGFYTNAGIDAYVFCDRLNNQATKSEIEGVATEVWEHTHSGFERLLAAEAPLTVIQAFIAMAAARPDFPTGIRRPTATDDERMWRDGFRQILEARKGEGYGELFISSTSVPDLPQTLRYVLGAVHEAVVGERLPAGDPLGGLLYPGSDAPT